ncbi:TetR/AcrR family transcriptional regulator [Silanimonas sp.]|jgi:AcrR family transcriptional regulator|uniref:TetR/AcrR family transcriptional regulator n=1 Tax=Silanimonas sp. TaxID=1929290 RepID=UPI0022BEA46C|nr:TetR/AcrR family transcriptional regulator [Silanimonas sp.]MCZ8116328.1 TetR/AcrR family transcriptional regulator [Silanimonas sp.]
MRRSPAQARGQLRVDTILDACESLLAKRHHSEVTIADIAASAGVKSGTIYHFFADKDAILASVLERVLDAQARAFIEDVPSLEVSFRTYLFAVESNLRVLWHRHGSLLDLFFAYQRHPAVWQLILAMRRRAGDAVALRLGGLHPELPGARAASAGALVAMVLSVLLDNLTYMDSRTGRRLRAEVYAMIESYASALHSEIPARVGGGDSKRLRRPNRVAAPDTCSAPRRPQR